MASGKLAHPFAEARFGAVLHREVFEEAVQVFGEIAGTGKAPCRVEFQAFGDERLEAPGNLGAAAPERGHLAAAGDHELDRHRVMTPPGGTSGKAGSPASISNRISPRA